MVENKGRRSESRWKEKPVHLFPIATYYDREDGGSILGKPSICLRITPVSPLQTIEQSDSFVGSKLSQGQKQEKRRKFIVICINLVNNILIKLVL